MFETSLNSMAKQFSSLNAGISEYNQFRLKRAWINVCLETAEICSKVLDWHSN